MSEAMVYGLKETGFAETPPKTTHGLYAITGPYDENLIFWLILVKMSKTPQGMKQVGQILLEMVKGSFSALETYCRAGAANEIAAWASGTLLSKFMERTGMISRGQAIDFVNGLNLLTGIGTVTGVLRDFLFGVHFPDTLNLGTVLHTRMAPKEEE